MRYGIYAAVVAIAFAAVEWRGILLWHTAAHAAIPQSVRSSPGGYRSYHFWHTGYHGGK